MANKPKIQRIVDAARAERDKQYRREMFQPGKLVMLRTRAMMVDGRDHPDAGRIGRVVSAKHGADGMPVAGSVVVVEFWWDEAQRGGVSHGTFCLLPLEAWIPVPDFLAEDYGGADGRRGWRLSERGRTIFDGLKWERTAQTEGLL